MRDIITIFVSSVQCSLIIVNLNKVDKEPTKKYGVLDNGKKPVTSNITQLSLAESLEK